MSRDATKTGLDIKRKLPINTIRLYSVLLLIKNRPLDKLSLCLRTSATVT